jgi:hypothetical protein
VHRVGGLGWINLVVDTDKWPACYCEDGSNALGLNNGGEFPEWLVNDEFFRGPIHPKLNCAV